MRLFLLLLIVLTFAPAAAQDDALTAVGVRLETRLDLYGQIGLYASGQLVNRSADAYTNLSLLAEAYDADGALVGEGIGYPVNACGAALLPDAALQPQTAHRFEVPLELYEPDAAVERVLLFPQGVPTQADATRQEASPGITRISQAEVVSVEWLDSRSLRYAVGCPRELFSDWQWFHHSVRAGVTTPAQHPKARYVTDALFERLDLTDPAFAQASGITFSPSSNRFAYQGDNNVLFTAEANGSNARLVTPYVFNRTLQGVDWTPDGRRFLAYYYGAYGDPVIYLSSGIDGRIISLPPQMLPPSVIVPGISSDARRAVIAGTFGGETGYFMRALINNSEPQLLFEAEPPGNNWPAPLFTSNNGEARSEVIYLARPVLGEARLQCFDMVRGGPFDLAPLPLNLATEDRARWWLSPDGTTVALAATGMDGGLWTIDLTQFGACGL